MGEGGNRGRGNASEDRQDKEDPRWSGGRCGEREGGKADRGEAGKKEGAKAKRRGSEEETKEPSD